MKLASGTIEKQLINFDVLEHGLFGPQIAVSAAQFPGGLDAVLVVVELEALSVDEVVVA